MAGSPTLDGSWPLTVYPRVLQPIPFFRFTPGRFRSPTTLRLGIAGPGGLLVPETVRWLFGIGGYIVARLLPAAGPDVVVNRQGLDLQATCRVHRRSGDLC